MLDRGTRLDGLDLEGGADVGEHRGPKGQRFGVVLLPTLILCAQVKGARVLEVGRQHDGLVAGLSRKLDAKVPGIEGDEDKVEVLGSQILGGKGIESADGVPEGTGISDVLPRERRQARCEAVGISSILGGGFGGWRIEEGGWGIDGGGRSSLREATRATRQL